MIEDRAASVPHPPRTRSRVSNGTRAFLNADGRSREGRLLRDRERELAGPLGGLDGLGTAQRSLVESAAALSVRLETVRGEIARGDPKVSDEDLVRLTNGLSRALTAIDRCAAQRAGPAKRGLSAYLARKEEAA